MSLLVVGNLCVFSVLFTIYAKAILNIRTRKAKHKCYTLIRNQGYMIVGTDGFHFLTNRFIKQAKISNYEIIDSPFDIQINEVRIGHFRL